MHVWRKKQQIFTLETWLQECLSAHIFSSYSHLLYFLLFPSTPSLALSVLAWSFCIPQIQRTPFWNQTMNLFTPSPKETIICKKHFWHYLFLETCLCSTSGSTTSLLGLPFVKEQWESIMALFSPTLAIQFTLASAFSMVEMIFSINTSFVSQEEEDDEDEDSWSQSFFVSSFPSSNSSMTLTCSHFALSSISWEEAIARN